MLNNRYGVAAKRLPSPILCLLTLLTVVWWTIFFLYWNLTFNHNGPDSLSSLIALPKEKYLKLSDIISDDFDEIAPNLSPIFFSKVGHVLLYFSGYEFREKQWIKTRQNLKLEDRVKLITPTWKGGKVDYSNIPVDNEAPLLSSTKSMIGWLSSVGLEMVSFPANEEDLISDAYEMMFSWNISMSHHFDSQPNAIFAFSFGAASPSCVTVEGCNHPGETNELLAHSILKFVQDKGPPFSIFAQWEIASFLQGKIPENINLFTAGNPNEYFSTSDIWECFWSQAVNVIMQQGPLHGIVMAHPDHVLRAWNTGVKSQENDNISINLEPALVPYLLNWPDHGSFTGSAVNLYDEQKVQLSTGRNASWYDTDLGYSPSNSQEWVRNREIWLLYELWARSKLTWLGTIDPVINNHPYLRGTVHQIFHSPRTKF